MKNLKDIILEKILINSPVDEKLLINSSVDEKLFINSPVDEKLLINKNTKVPKSTGEVLVVPIYREKVSGWAAGYERSLILNCLEDFNKRYIFDDVIVKVESANNVIFSYSLYNKFTHEIHTDDRNTAFRITLYNGQRNNILKTPCIKELIEKISEANNKYLIFETPMSSITAQYLYIWMSKEKQCLEILMSNKTYDDLQLENTFV